jgi:hypothetical protein
VTKKPSVPHKPLAVTENPMKWHEKYKFPAEISIFS